MARCALVEGTLYKINHQITNVLLVRWAYDFLFKFQNKKSGDLFTAVTLIVQDNVNK